MSSPATPVTPPSATDAASQAMALVGRRLFPFRFEVWLALGFVAFLEQCGRSGASAPGMRMQRMWNAPDGRMPDVSWIGRWASAHMPLLVVLAVLGLAFTVVLTALLLWLNSRGIFMYVDNVATGRSDVSRPWREHAELAASLFAWRFALAMMMLLVGLMLAGGLLLVFAGGREARAALGFGRVIAAFALIGVTILVAIAAALVSVALRDFVAPLQWHLRVACGPAFRIFVGILTAHPGTFAVYLLLKLLFVVVFAMIAAALCCLTCGCGLLPVVAQTLLQPVFYFERAWSLLLLQQFGYGLVPLSVPPPQAAG